MRWMPSASVGVSGPGVGYSLSAGELFVVEFSEDYALISCS